MIRHQRRPMLAAVAALACLFASSSVRAQSVQMAINTAFVGNVNNGDATLCTVSGTPPRYTCAISNSPSGGNISNDPEIQFANNALSNCNFLGATRPGTAAGNNGLWFANPRTEVSPYTLGLNICNDEVFLCAQVVVNDPGASTSETIQIDMMEFEIFRFVDGANPLDPASTPPLRTFFLDNPGSVTLSSALKTDYLPNSSNAYCALWDGSQPIQGGFGRINGQYGFRVTVQTNQVGASGNITLTATRAYPSGATYDSAGNSVSQKAILVETSDIHVIRSTPTIVGQVTGVSAQPYNFTYRLSKDATMYLTITSSTEPFTWVRQLVPGLPRTGEGALGSASAVPLVNGESWDGRDTAGNVLPAGSYLALFQAQSDDLYGMDSSLVTPLQIGLDPLQITDIRVQPLLGGSTSLAVLTYQLTEPATVYVDIYPPGTQFCSGLLDVSDPLIDGTATNFPAAKDFGATLGTCGSAKVSPIKSIVQQQTSRTSVLAYWDGRDLSGNLVNDGDYVFVMYASLPSQRGVAYTGSPGDKRIWTALPKTGFMPILRGLVGLTQVTPSSTVLGSSPAIAGINPFTFRYQLSRDAVASLKIFDATGTRLVKTIVDRATRPGLFNNVETWSDGADDGGLTVSSGVYLAQLTAFDPDFPAKVSTTTAQFPVDMFRITDVSVTPLLSGASDQVVLNYQLSQPMFVAWNIYPAGSVVVNSTGAWPPCAGQSPPDACTSASVVSPGGQQVAPVVSFHGMRPGRLRVSEFWDGRDANGIYVPDGNYVYTLVAQSTTTPPTYTSEKIFGNVTVARGSLVFQSFNVTPDVPALVNSSNTITLDPFTITYALSRQSSVTVQILNTAVPPAVVRTLVSGSVRQGGILQSDVWDGRDDNGNFPASGFYLARAVAYDVSSSLTAPSTAQMTISHDPLRLYDLAITPLTTGAPGAILSYQVSEPMKVAIKIYKPGTRFDSSGNPSPPDSTSLVRRIVGVRAARTQIQDTWDGRDFRLALVPDGVYRFKIVGSTDTSAIDDLTGNVLNPSALASDRFIDDIPVAVNASLDPRADFEGNTFVYPNPVTGPTGTFCIYTPFHAKVLLKLYNIAGDLILSRDFGDRPASFQSSPTSQCTGGVPFVWNKTNQGGRPIARGVYYAVIRVEETEGGANVLQTVKKVLVP